MRSDAEGGDVSLVTVELSPGQSGRVQLREAAAQIQAGERAVKHLLGATDNTRRANSPQLRRACSGVVSHNSGGRCYHSPADRHNSVSMCAAGGVPTLPVRLCVALCR